jgi:hypothetical protein
MRKSSEVRKVFAELGNTKMTIGGLVRHQCVAVLFVAACVTFD